MLEALKTWSSGCDEMLKQRQVSVTSCRSAVSDMLSARSHAESEAKKQEEKKAEDGKKLREAASAGLLAKKRNVKVPTGIALLDLDFLSTVAVPVPSEKNAWPKVDGESLPLRKPAVISGCEWIQEKVKGTKAILFL